jgi:hypothetical protein
MNSDQVPWQKGIGLFVRKPTDSFSMGQKQEVASEQTRSLFNIASKTLRELVSVSFAHIISRLMHHSGHCHVSSVHDRNHANAQPNASHMSMSETSKSAANATDQL